MASASFAFHSLADRLGHDLRTSFPAMEVHVRQLGDDVVCEVFDGPDMWGAVSLAEDFDDEFSADEIEIFIMTVVTYVTDNLWPDELIDPWSRCPAHRDHPLQPALVSRRASWRCLRDGPDRTRPRRRSSRSADIS